jgi:hypothetical protein
VRLTRTVHAAAVLLASLTVALTPTAADTAPLDLSSAQQAAPGDTITLPVRDALQALPVHDEDRTGPVG